ncbi:hypothetical protein WDU94_007584 [Cyamophila willieti]
MMHQKYSRGNSPKPISSGDGKVLKRRKRIGVVHDIKRYKPKITMKRKTRKSLKDGGWIRGIKNKYKECTGYFINGRLSGNNNSRKSTPKSSCQSRSTSRKTHDSFYSRKSRSPYSKSNESKRTHHSFYSRKSRSPYSKSNESKRTHHSPYSRKSRSPYSKTNESKRSHNSPYSRKSCSTSRPNESRRTSQGSRQLRNHSFGGVRGPQRSAWQFHSLNKTFSFWNNKYGQSNNRRSPKRAHYEKIENNINRGIGGQTWKGKQEKGIWYDELNRNSSRTTKRQMFEGDSQIRSNWKMNMVNSNRRSRSPLQKTRRDWRTGTVKYRSPGKMKSTSFLDSRHVTGRNRWTLNENEDEWKNKCKPISKKSCHNIWNVENERSSSPWKSRLNERKYATEQSPRIDRTKRSNSTLLDENYSRKHNSEKSPCGRVKSWLCNGIPQESRKFGHTQNVSRQNTNVTPTYKGKILSRHNTLKMGQNSSNKNHRSPKRSPLKDSSKESRKGKTKEINPITMKSNCTDKMIGEGIGPQKSPHTAYRIRRTSEWIDTNCVPIEKSVCGDDNISERKRKKYEHKRNTDDVIIKNKIHRGVKSEPLQIHRTNVSNKFVAPKSILSKRKSKYSYSTKSPAVQNNSRKNPEIKCRENARQRDDDLSNKNPKVGWKSSPAVNHKHKRKEEMVNKNHVQHNVKSEHGNRMSGKKDTQSKRISKWNTKSQALGTKDMKDEDSFDEFRVKVPKLKSSSPELLECCWCRYCLGLTSKRPICCLYAFEEKFNNKNESHNASVGVFNKKDSYSKSDRGNSGKNNNLRKTHRKEKAKSMFNKGDSVVAFHHTEDVPNLCSRGDCNAGGGAPKKPKNRPKLKPVAKKSESKEIDLVVLNKESNDETALSEDKKVYGVHNPFKVIELVNKKYGQEKQHLTLQIRKRKLNDGEPKTNLKLIWS